MFKRLVALWKQVQEVQTEALESKSQPPAPEDAAAVAALKAQAQSCARLGDWAGAERCFREVLDRAPQDADGHALLGHFLYTRAHAERDAPAFRSQQAEALAYLHAAVRLDPDLYQAHYHLGYWARVEDAQEEAELHLERCLLLAPEYEPAMLELLYALLEKDGPTAARARLESYASRMRTPELKVAWAWVLQCAGEDEQALAMYKAVLAENPGAVDAALQQGVVQLRRLEISEALVSLDRFRQRPDQLRGQLVAGYMLLAMGCLQEGFRLYERRFSMLSGEYKSLTDFMRLCGAHNRWTGDPLAGRRLLVWAEQGLGDTLMFIRFLPALRQQLGVDRIIMAVQPPLRTLVEESGLADEVIALAEVRAEIFDVHCPSMSLPTLLNTALKDLPGISFPYFKIPQTKIDFWKARLASLPGRKVGVVWAGSPSLSQDAHRSIPLSQWAPILAVEGVSFISLQKGPGAGQCAELEQPLVDWMDECQDMLDTAALISGLDLVIAVDTAVAHLAGALGKPVFLLNRYESEWRWLFGREDSPWYPSLRQFRQTAFGDWGPALQHVAQTLAAWELAFVPDLKAAEVLKDEGNRLLAEGDLAGAGRCYEQALLKAPGYPRALSNLGFLRHQQGLEAEARIWTELALESAPELAQAHYNLGAWAKAAGDLVQARTHLERCLDLEPAHTAAAVELAYVLVHMQCADEARVRLAACLQNAATPELQLVWGRILDACGKRLQAREIYRQVVECTPELKAAKVHLGVNYTEALELAQAERVLQPFAEDVSDPEGQLAYGNLCLLQGRLKEGFALYERRLDLDAPDFKFLQKPSQHFGFRPHWKGESLVGKRLLVWAEQGLGDTLMFVRFLPWLRRLGVARVLVAVQPQLERLVRASCLADEVLSMAQPQEECFDLVCSLVSLPHRLGLTLDDLPGAVLPYLKVPGAKRVQWMKRLERLSGLKVGIVWAGNPRLIKDALRSIPLAQWAPVLQVPGVSFVSLQKGDAAGQLEGLPYPVAHWMDDSHELLDTAALISGLDLVIAVDTAVAHLAGALGKPVFLLNRHESEWRWMLGREDSPWYPTLRQFRQDAPGDWAGALARVARALAAQDLFGEADPARAEQLKDEGNQKLVAGDLVGAEAAYRAALKLQPGYPAALNNLGRVLYDQGQLLEARECMLRALLIDPELAPAHYNLGHWARRAKQYQEARQHLERCLALMPMHQGALIDLGFVLVDLALPELARERVEAVLTVDSSPELKTLHAKVLCACGAFPEALVAYQQIVLQHPECWQARMFLGELLMQCLRLSEAIDVLRHADLQSHPEAQVVLGEALLMAGQWPEGFAAYEARLKSVGYSNLRQPLACFGQRPFWQGEALRGRRLVVWAEQGLGDSIMLARLLPLLKARGAGDVTLAVPAPLCALLRSSGLADRVMPLVPRSPDAFDLHCSIVSLPALLGLTMDALACLPSPYLTVPLPVQERWAARLAGLSGLKVGVVWAGNPKLGKDRLRSIPLAQWAPILQVPHVSFVSLQTGEAAAQRQAQPYPISDWMDECPDMLDTAALMCGLDLVIAVDTAVAHLAGALGKPVFLLNRHESEWRWMLGREDSPWYPTLRQFRQDNPNDWGATLSRVARALAEWRHI